MDVVKVIEILNEDNIKLRRDIATKNEKIAKLEENETILNKKLQYYETKIKEVYSELEEKETIIKSIAANNSIMRTRLKGYFDVCSRQQLRQEKLIQNELDKMNDFLNKLDLELSKVHIHKKSTEKFPYEFIIKNASEKKDGFESCRDILLLKEFNNISDRVYNKLVKDAKLDIPKLAKIKKYREEIDSKFKINQNSFGVYVDPVDKITFILNIKLKDLDIKNDLIKIKLCGDGALVGKNLKLFTFRFSCLNETNKAKSAEGSYALGIFEIESENYNTLKECLKEIVEKLNGFNKVELSDGKTYNIKLFMGGDLKFLSCIFGINSANSYYPCVWCKCHKEEFHDLDQDWSIKDTNKGARTIKDAEMKLLEKSKKNEKFGYINTPIVHVVDFDSCVVDMLHLLLRITDKLTDLLLEKLREIDEKEIKAICHLNDIEKLPNQKKFYQFVTKVTGYSKPYYDKDNRIVLKTFSGDHKLRILEKIHINELFPDLVNKEKVNAVWAEFCAIYQMIRRNELDSQKLKEKTKGWLEAYKDCYENKHITPYIHIFVFHLHEFVEDHGDVNLFNCQGLEKTNHINTKIYFQGTNKHKNLNGNDSYLIQILKRNNKQEYLQQFVAAKTRNKRKFESMDPE